MCRKFALIASAGEFAHEHGIFPYEKEDAWKAAERWFKIWLNQRDSIGDLEVAKVLRRIQDHFAVESESRYVPIINSQMDSRFNKAGYSWDDISGSKRYLMLPPVSNEILKGINRKVILDELSKRGWIELKSDGSIRETKSINGRNYRGYIFIPESWEEKSDQKSALLMKDPSLIQFDLFE